MDAVLRRLHRDIKRGLAKALHSGDPAFDALPDYSQRRLLPALQTLLRAAAREVRTDINPNDLLSAGGGMGMHAANDSADQTQRMVALLIDGLRYGEGTPSGKTTT